MQTIQLTPEELAKFTSLQENVDGFVAGARALAEHLKTKQINEIVGARQVQQPPTPPEPPAPESPKE